MTRRGLNGYGSLSSDTFVACFEAGDRKEGMEAFLEGVEKVYLCAFALRERITG